MKKALVTGASGHIGSYLVPRLVEKGYEVHAVSRGIKKPYTDGSSAWDKVIHHTVDRRSEDGAARLGELLSELEPDVFCDLISFKKTEVEASLLPILTSKPEAASKMHVVQIGTAWVYGVKLFVPVTEDHPRNSTAPYGMNKAEIEKYLHTLSVMGKIKSTVLLPGHICGAGWIPINPQGNDDIGVYSKIKAGLPVIIPDDGNHTLHHVHGDDIAALAVAAIENPDRANGETFNAVTEKAVTLSGFAESLYRMYGKEPKIEYVRMEKLASLISDEAYHDTCSHLKYSSHSSMEKAKRVLGFVPRYTEMDIMKECLAWLEEKGLL